jgi:peptide/nickel transport system substrate-binding protein
VTGSSDFKTWTIKLRDGVKFSDGTPLDAAAVQYNFQRYALPASTQTPEARDVTGTTISDPLTLVVTLKAPNAQWPLVLMRGMGMIGSPTAIKAMGDDKFSQAPVAAGPFMVKQHVAGDSIVLVRNPTFWDSPRPYLDQITLKTITDATQAYNTFNGGGADMIAASGLVTQMDQLQTAGIPVLAAVQLGGAVTIFNTKKAPLDDVGVRQALSYATDLDDFNNKVFNGKALPATSLFPKDSPFYTSDDVQPVNNLTKAQQLIDTYVAAHGGQPLKIAYLGATTNKAAADVLVQQWSRLKNVVATESIVPLAQLQSQTFAGDFQVSGGSVAGMDPAWELTNRYTCNSSRNVTYFCNAQADADLLKGTSTNDKATRQAAYNDFRTILFSQMPSIFMYRNVNQVAVSKKMTGVTQINVGYLDWANFGFKS